MSAVVVCVALVCINVFLWIVFFFLCKRRFSAREILQDIQTEVSNLLVEINREADRSISIIDARRKGLQKLLDEAKRYTEFATAEFDKRARNQGIYDALQREARPARPRRTTYSPSGAQQSLFPDDAVGSFFPSLLDEQSDEVAISGDVPASDAAGDPFPAMPAMPRITRAAETVKVEKDLRTRVLELSAEGFSPDLIAAKLEVSITEVQLIIDMYGI